MKIPALSKRVAVMANFAMLFYSTIRRRLQVVTPDGLVLDVEHTGRQGVAGGYPSLNGDGYVYTAQLGSGAAGTGSKFLADDYTWKAGGGGGVTAHPDLTSLAWSASGHTGTANRVAGFDGGGAATYLTGRDVCNFVLTTRGDMMYRDATEATRLPIGAANRLLLSDGTDPAWASPADVRTALDLATYYQPLDAGLTSLTAADASAGLPYVSAANTWATATYSGMLSVVGGAWKVVGLRESGGQDLTMGAVADGEVLRRSGTTVAGSSADTIVSDAAGANGLVTRTASGAVTARTLTAGDGIDVAYGDGVSGNPTVAVQASVKGFQLYELFTVIQPQGTVAPNVDGVGSSITSAGVYSVNPSGTDFPCTQYGDASASTSRFYVQGYYRMEAGTVTTDILFKMGSDIAAGITCMFVGFSSNVALSTADPTGHRYTIRWVRGTDTNWQLSVKDNTTQTLVDTGVAVTADYYYAVRFVASTASVAVQISAGATVAAAKSGIDAAGSTSTSSNLPLTANDLYIIATMVRSAASTSRNFKFGYWRTIQRPA